MSDYDPFDNAPVEVEEEFVEESVFDAPPAEAPKKPPAKKVVKAPSVGDDGKIVLTFKEGAGFDSSWTVVHASNVEEANAILSDPGFKALLDRSKKVAAYFRGGGEPSGQRQQSAPAGRPQGAQEPPPGAPPAPGPDWQYKTGMKKDGSGTWQAWMPPRGSDARPKFF